jgi:hypothetical protein
VSKPVVVKKCSRCGLVKPAAEFYKMRDSLQSRCKDCAKAGAAKWNKDNRERATKNGRGFRERHPGYHVDWRLKNVYGLTKDQYEELLKTQDGVCAICRSDDGRPLVVDHDHSCCPVGAEARSSEKTCGKCVRGLLCSSCNAILGHLENKEFIERAVAYLAARGGAPLWQSQ